MSGLKNGNIVLIGFMGSGKTTFGRWIAKKYKMDFCDTDEYIERKQGRSIKDIFAQDGEEVFRNMETETVRELAGEMRNTVFSVGGGLPVREENRALLRGLGTVVYLLASEEELCRRLAKDESRPLLSGADIRTRIHTLMDARADIYKDAADIMIHTDGVEFEDMYRELSVSVR